MLVEAIAIETGRRTKEDNASGLLDPRGSEESKITPSYCPKLVVFSLAPEGVGKVIWC